MTTLFYWFPYLHCPYSPLSNNSISLIPVTLLKLIVLTHGHKGYQGHPQCAFRVLRHSGSFPIKANKCRHTQCTNIHITASLNSRSLNIPKRHRNKAKYFERYTKNILTKVLLPMGVQFVASGHHNVAIRSDKIHFLLTCVTIQGGTQIVRFKHTKTPFYSREFSTWGKPSSNQLHRWS